MAAKLTTRQPETALQKFIIEHINKSNLGCYVFRCKNTGTYDPTIGIFRKGSTDKGIPDIIGTAKNGRSIYIEVKVTPKSGNCVPSMIKIEQKTFLTRMKSLGAIVGVAWDYSDAFDIIADNEEMYKRKQRTFYYDLNMEFKNAKRKTKERDPIKRHVSVFTATLEDPKPLADGKCEAPKDDPTI